MTEVESLELNARQVWMLAARPKTLPAAAAPVIVNNEFVGNEAAAITIDVNSLKSFQVSDWGRSTGPADRFLRYADNVGPLVRENEILDLYGSCRLLEETVGEFRKHQLKDTLAWMLKDSAPN